MKKIGIIFRQNRFLFFFETFVKVYQNKINIYIFLRKLSRYNEISVKAFSKRKGENDMVRFKRFVAVISAIFLLMAAGACDRGPKENGGEVSNFYIESDIYDQLDPDYRFDIDAVKVNKNRYSGTLYMARAYGDELSGWEYVYDVYQKMYPNVKIVNNEYSSGQDMKQALVVQMQSGSETVGLMQGNYVEDQLKSSGYNFQGGFTDMVNPYASPAGEENEVLVGDLLDDYTYQSLASTRITFQKTTTGFFVNATALAEAGMTTADIQTWDDIIEACRRLKEKGYTAPFGLGGSNDSITTKDFSWLYKIYIDQYYRDMIDDIQVQPADYNYNKETAEAFQFSFEKNDYETDPNYKVNSMRAYNLLLNPDADNPYYVGAKSEKFKCFIDNLLKISPYVSRGFATNGIMEIQQSFLRGGKDDAVFMINYAGYGVALDNYKNTGGINFDWDCFDYVPMVCSCNVVCNENGVHKCTHVDDAETEDECTLHVKTTKTRDVGGIGGYIGLYTDGKTEEEIELYLDFVKFFLSPYGQSLFYKGLEQNAGWPKAESVIDGVVFPSSWSNYIKYSEKITFDGICAANWFLDFLGGCIRASGSQYTECKTALQNNIPTGNASRIIDIFDVQIKSYANDALSMYKEGCYLNYTQKPLNK